VSAIDSSNEIPASERLEGMLRYGHSISGCTNNAPRWVDFIACNA
jgi:hypothetical protein